MNSAAPDGLMTESLLPTPQFPADSLLAFPGMNALWEVPRQRCLPLMSWPRCPGWSEGHPGVGEGKMVLGHLDLCRVKCVWHPDRLLPLPMVIWRLTACTPRKLRVLATGAQSTVGGGLREAGPQNHSSTHSLSQRKPGHRTAPGSCCRLSDQWSDQPMDGWAANPCPSPEKSLGSGWVFLIQGPLSQADQNQASWIGGQGGGERRMGPKGH